MGLDYTKVDTTYTPTRWRRMSIHLLEEDTEDWNMLDASSKTWYQYVYDNVAAAVAQAVNLTEDSVAADEITFTFEDGDGAAVDTYKVYYLGSAAGTENAETIKSTGSEFVGTIAKVGTTIGSLSASTQYGIVVETINEVATRLSAPLFSTTTA